MIKKQVDAVISLGAFCQVGGALWVYGLKYVNSPLDNYGIKTWNSIIPILQSRFENYWRAENMTIGKAVMENSNRHGDQRMMLKAYCNKYNIVSNHNFELEENSPTELKTFDLWRNKLDHLQNIFLKQCAQLDEIRFICKAMNWPNPNATEISSTMIHDLMTVLQDLRQGKNFSLAMLVPAARFEELFAWSQQSPWANQLILAPWSIDFNNEKHPEWDSILGDVELAPDSFGRLMNQIIGNPEASLAEINNF